MGLKTKYATREEAPEFLREFLVEKNGRWLLDLEDSDTLEALRKERNDHEIAKKGLKERDATLEELKRRLDVFEQYGSPEEIDAMKKQIDALQPPPKVEDLQKQLESVTAKLREEEKWRKMNEPELASLRESYTKLSTEVDHGKARGAIREIVKSLKGVNADALEENLFLQYKAGGLKRSDAGEIVSTEGDLPLGEYAENYARNYKFFLPNVSGGANPPGTPSGNGDRIAALKAEHAEAMKNRNVNRMLELKAEIGKLENSGE